MALPSRALRHPATPELWDLHNLPDFEKFLFTKEREVSRSAEANRFKSTSFTCEQGDTTRSESTKSKSFDCPNTVLPQTLSPSIGVANPAESNVTMIRTDERSSSHRPVVCLRESSAYHSSGSEFFKEVSHQARSPARPAQSLHDTTDSGTTKLCNTRLGIQGGSGDNEGLPRLRGGTNHQQGLNSVIYKLKRKLYKCSGPYSTEFDTDDGTKSSCTSRHVSPPEMMKMKQRSDDAMHKTASLHPPKKIKQTSLVQNIWPDTGELPPHTSFTTTISGPISNAPKRSLSLSFPTWSISIFSYRRFSPTTTQPSTTSQRRTIDPPTPHLRGGAESPERTPPTLFWLAGGTGRKPISFDGWKKSRPKQRMGGLFGMSVFGNKYGQEYKVTATAANDGVEVACSASICVVTDRPVSIKGAKRHRAGTPSPAEVPSPIAVVDTVPIENDTTYSANDGLVQQAQSPMPTDVSGDVPLCSGALPVEDAKQPATADTSQPILHSDTERRDSSASRILDEGA